MARPSTSFPRSATRKENRRIKFDTDIPLAGDDLPTVFVNIAARIPSLEQELSNMYDLYRKLKTGELAIKQEDINPCISQMHCVLNALSDAQSNHRAGVLNPSMVQQLVFAIKTCASNHVCHNVLISNSLSRLASQLEKLVDLGFKKRAAMSRCVNLLCTAVAAAATLLLGIYGLSIYWTKPQRETLQRPNPWHDNQRSRAITKYAMHGSDIVQLNYDYDGATVLEQTGDVIYHFLDAADSVGSKLNNPSRVWDKYLGGKYLKLQTIPMTDLKHTFTAPSRSVHYHKKNIHYEYLTDDDVKFYIELLPSEYEKVKHKYEKPPKSYITKYNELNNQYISIMESGAETDQQVLDETKQLMALRMELFALQQHQIAVPKLTPIHDMMSSTFDLYKFQIDGDEAGLQNMQDELDEKFKKEWDNWYRGWVTTTLGLVKGSTDGYTYTRGLVKGAGKNITDAGKNLTMVVP